MTKTLTRTSGLILLMLLPMMTTAQVDRKDGTDAKKRAFVPPHSEQQDHILSFGIDMLSGEHTTSPRFRITYGQMVAQQLKTGIGTGFTFYNDPVSLVPVYLNLNYNLSDAPSLFFIDVKAGYNISILTDTDISVDDHKGGVFINPSLGMNIPTESGFSLTINIGYSIEKASFSQDNTWNEEKITTDITYKRLMGGIGFTF